MQRLAFLVGASLSLTAVGAAQRLIGVSFNGALVTINPATGVGSALGNLGFSGAGGLARVDDAMYTNTNGGALWKIDPWTGAAYSGPTTSPVLNSIRAMATDRVGIVYAIQNGGGQIGTTTPDLLYAIDPRTGAATLRGSTSTFVGIQGLAFSPAGALYGWDTTAGLVSISPLSAVTTDVNAAVGAVNDIQALSFSPGGVLYGARNNVYTINLSTGVPTLVGTGGYSDLRGIEFTHGPRIYENGPLVTHPGGGFGGADLSMVQTSLGLTAAGWVVDVNQGLQLVDDFQTNGAWLADAVEFFLYSSSGTLAVNDVRLAIYNNPPNAGGTEVPGSPGMQTNLCQQIGYEVTNTFTDIYRAAEATPLSSGSRIQRVRVQFAAPINLFSALLPSGRYWLRFSCRAINGTLAMPPVSTRGFSSPGNALFVNGGGVVPLSDAGHPQAMPFTFFGISAAPSASITNLGGGCGPATASFDVRGATVAGGALLHEVSGSGAFPGILIGLTDPNLSLAPLCSCVQHASLDFFAFGAPTYTLVAPPGVGTGFEYYTQGVQIDFLGASGLPCDLGLGFDLRLTDAYRVRFW